MSCTIVEVALVEEKSVISVGSENLGTRTETKSQQQERAAIDNELKTR